MPLLITRPCPNKGIHWQQCCDLVYVSTQQVGGGGGGYWGGGGGILLCRATNLAWLTPSLLQPIKFSGRYRYRCTFKQWIFRPVTKLISVLCILMKILSHFHTPAQKKEKKKGFRLSNSALLMVVFQRHHGSEGVNNVALREPVHVACETHGTLISSPCLASPLPTLLLSLFPSSSSSSLPPFPSLPPSPPPPTPQLCLLAAAPPSPVVPEVEHYSTEEEELVARPAPPRASLNIESGSASEEGINQEPAALVAAFCSHLIFKNLIRTRLIFFFFNPFCWSYYHCSLFSLEFSSFCFTFGFGLPPLVPSLPKSLLLSWS